MNIIQVFEHDELLDSINLFAFQPQILKGLLNGEL